MTRGIRDEDAERRRDEGEPVTIENVRAIRATDKALLCEIGGREVWVPQSQITDDSEVYEVTGEDETAGKLVVTEWWAKKNGFDE